MEWCAEDVIVFSFRIAIGAYTVTGLKQSVVTVEVPFENCNWNCAPYDKVVGIILINR